MYRTSLKSINFLIFNILLFLIYSPRFVLLINPLYLKIALRFIGCLIVFILFMIKVNGEKKIDIFVIIMFIYVIWFVMNSIIHKSDGLDVSIYQVMLAMSSVFFVNYFCKYKKEFIYYSYFYFSFFIVLNFIIDLFTNFSDFVFMNSNNNFNFYIPLLLFSFLILEYNKKFIYCNLFLYLIMIVTSYIQDATSTGVLIVFIIMYYYLFNDKKYSLLFNYVTYSIVFILTFLFIIWLGSNSPIMPIFSKLFNKEITLSGRTPIYDLAVYHILRNPILGYGVFENDSMYNFVKFPYCHNIILDQLFKGGLIALVLFIIMIVYVIKHINNYKVFNKTNCLLLTFLFIFLLRNNFESPGPDTIAYFLSLSYFMSTNQKDYISIIK